MAKIVIADSHESYRAELVACLLRKADGGHISQADSWAAVCKCCGQEKPDILILGDDLPGLATMTNLSLLVEISPLTALIVLASQPDRAEAIAALRAGARGFIPKDGTAEEIDFALETVSQGHRWLSPLIMDGILAEFIPSPQAKSIASFEALSARENTVLRLFCEEKTPKEIAGILGISRKTVDNHKTNLMRKLGVTTTQGLVKIAIMAEKANAVGLVKDTPQASNMPI